MYFINQKEIDMGFFSSLFSGTAVVESTAKSVALAWKALLEVDPEMDGNEILQNIILLRPKRKHLEYQKALSLIESLPSLIKNKSGSKTPFDVVWLVINVEMGVFEIDLKSETMDQWSSVINNELEKVGLPKS
jgi:hypothetical protein